MFPPRGRSQRLSQSGARYQHIAAQPGIPPRSPIYQLLPRSAASRGGWHIRLTPVMMQHSLLLPPQFAMLLPSHQTLPVGPSSSYCMHQGPEQRCCSQSCHRTPLPQPRSVLHRLDRCRDLDHPGVKASQSARVVAAASASPESMKSSCGSGQPRFVWKMATLGLLQAAVVPLHFSQTEEVAIEA